MASRSDIASQSVLDGTRWSPCSPLHWSWRYPIQNSRSELGDFCETELESVAHRSDIFASPDGSLMGFKGGEGGLPSTTGEARVVALESDEDEEVGGEGDSARAGNVNDTVFFGFSQVLIVRGR